MPLRTTPLVTNQIYHILNRGSGAIPIFNSDWDYKKFLQIMFYYQNTKPPLKFSRFFVLSKTEKEKILKELRGKNDFWVEIISYCLMPNHFHLLLKQIKDGGIFKLTHSFLDSYSHFFNLKNKRKGGLFEGRFRAIRVETDSQLLHLSRYIHLNPYSSYLVKDFAQLINYPYSSLPEYLGLTSQSLCNKEIVLSSFSNIDDYKKFLFDRADYQRSLEEIKHQLLEK